MSWKNAKIVAAVIAVIAVAMIAWEMLHNRVDNPRSLETAELLRELANDATQAMDDKESTKVRAPQFGAEPIGTLIDPKRTLGVGRGCRIAVEPMTQTPTGFPPQVYRVTTTAGAAVTHGFLNTLVSSLSLGAQSEVSLRFDDVEAKLLYDDDIIEMAATPECRKRLNGRTLWIVRGFIQARRTFAIRHDFTDAGGITDSLSNSTFNVTLSKDRQELEVVDKQPLPLFELVSALDPMSRNPVQAPKLDAAAQIGAVAVNGKTELAAESPLTKLSGLIYFQRDASDASGNDKRLIALIKAKGLPVEPVVQKIDPGRSPKQASVRYFNDADRAEATTVLGIVRANYPDATLNRFGLTAPRGQLEVWLPATVSTAADGAEMVRP